MHQRESIKIGKTKDKSPGTPPMSGKPAPKAKPPSKKG